jgi:hypothetical protein
MPQAKAMGADPQAVAKDIRRRLLDGQQSFRAWEPTAVQKFIKLVDSVCDSLDKIAESFKEMRCGMIAVVTVEFGHVEVQATGYEHVP